MCLFQEAHCKAQESTEGENNFLEFYSKNKDHLDQEAPFASTVENFAQYHEALVNVIMKFEKSKSFEDEFPVEGKTTSIQKELLIVKYFNFLLNEVTAKSKEGICFYGGWPSRILNNKCQSPWKNNDDEELKRLGSTYDSRFFCGGKNLFRCNPLLFGPGKDSKGFCVKFENAADISDLCYDKSVDQIQNIYKSFKENPEFRKNYLATVAAMKNFCASWSTYPACKVLTLQENEIAFYTCSQLEKGDILSNAPIASLAKSVGSVTKKVLEKSPATPAQPEIKKRAIAQESEIQIEPPAKLTSVTNVQVCTHYKDFLSHGVPEIALKQAITYYSKNKSTFSNNRYISIADYSQNSRTKRFHLLDLDTGTVTSEKVSHGSGSADGVDYGDQDHDGMLDKCTNNGSKKNMTRPGFYKIEDFYESEKHTAKYIAEHPNEYHNEWPLLEGSNNGMKMIGLSSTNRDAFDSGVVMHEADYNEGGSAVMGRSWGCPAFVPGRGAPLMKKMKGESLFYAYAPVVCEKEMGKVLDDPKVKGWQTACEK